MTARPLVSVVIATYNRAHLLRHAIDSVVRGTLEDWEIIVVGDCCTDDSEDCVRSFGDPRISFVNLPQNCGEQSAPNNHGLGLARGRTIAFLNQDDLYFPDHLAHCVARLESGGADLVWVPCGVAQVIPAGDLEAGRWKFRLCGVPSSAPYSPFAFYSASSWVFKRALVETVGPWRPARSLFVTPSQEWLFRAWRSGAALAFLPRVSVLLIFSGERHGSYVAEASPEHEVFAAAMADDPGFREKLLESAAVEAAQSAGHNLFERPAKGIARALAYPLHRLLMAFGMHPSSLNMMLKFGGRGHFIRHLRRTTGLDP